MRLNCETEVHYRFDSGGAGPAPKQSKRSAAYSTLTLSRHPIKKKPFLQLGTVRDPCRTKYQIDGNIKQAYTRYVHEGRARISFNSPKHDVVIMKADPTNLRSFLQLLRRLVRGYPVDDGDFSQPPTKVVLIKESMVVVRRADYPSQFPGTLKKLAARGCSLRTVGREVTSLQQLSDLDLGENCLREIPMALGDLSLCRLVLCGNNIKCIPERLLERRVRDTLEELDISLNELSVLPPGLCHLPKLAKLLVSKNALEVLPDSMGFMRSLRVLDLAFNKLEYLPGSMVKLKLDWLSVLRNPMGGVGRIPPFPPKVPSLLAFACGATVATGAQLTAEDVPRDLLHLLWASGWCHLCDTPVFPEAGAGLMRIIRLHNLVRQSGSLVLGVGESSDVPLQALVCLNDAQRFQEISHAILRSKPQNRFEGVLVLN